MVTASGPYYPGTVIKSLSDANLTVIAQDDVSVAHALNATFSDTEVEAALNALGTAINQILDVLRELGLCVAE